MKHNISVAEQQQNFARFSAGEDFHRDVNRLLICAAPKSGSSFFHRICTLMPNYSNAVLVPGYAGREQELDIRKLIMTHDGFDDYASHLHLRYSAVTRDLMSQFDLKPVITTRNIFDTIVSIRDYYYSHRELAERENFSVDINGPTAYVPPCVYQWDEEKLYMYIADMVVPWYFNFLISWQMCDHAYWVRYEEMVSNTFDVVKGLSDFYQLEWQEADIADAISESQNRPSETKMNKGVTGRGKDLPESVKRNVYQKAEYYKAHDLSPFGLYF